jgi:hypothetical protein
MLHRSIGAAAFIIVFADMSHAQVLPGDTINRWNGAWAAQGYGVARSHAPEDVWREQQSEHKYREALKTIPNKKPSNDPWKNVRQAPASSAVDRHRVE